MIFMRGLSQAVNIVTFVVLVEENKDFTECGDKWLGKLHQCGNSGPSLQLGRPCRVNYLALDIFSLPPSLLEGVQQHSRCSAVQREHFHFAFPSSMGIP